MAIYDEIIRLGLNVVNFITGANQAGKATGQIEVETEKLIKRLDQLQKMQAGVKASFDAGHISLDRWRKSSERIGQDIAGVTDKLNFLAGNTMGRNGALARAGVQLGQGLQDAMYSPIGALNNVSFAVDAVMQGLKVTPGTMAAVSISTSILTSALTALYFSWDAVKASFTDQAWANQFKTTLDKVKDTIKSLEASGMVDAVTMDRVKRQQSGIESAIGAGAGDTVRGITTDIEDKRAAAVASSLKGIGGKASEQMVEDLSAGERKQLSATNSDILSRETKIAELRKQIDDKSLGYDKTPLIAEAGRLEAELVELRKGVAEEARKNIGFIMQDAQKGVKSGTKELIERLRATGKYGKLADQMEFDLWKATGGQEKMDREQAENEAMLEKEQAKLKKERQEKQAKAKADQAKFFKDERERKLKSQQSPDDGMDIGAIDLGPEGQKEFEREANPALRQIEMEQRRREITADIAAKHRADRRNSLNDRIQRTGALDDSVQMMMMLRTSREQGGMGLDAGEAADAVRAQAYKYARSSRFVGGLGLSKDKAAEFATQAVLNAAPLADKALEQGADATPALIRTNEDMIEMLRANIEVQKEMLRRGVPIPRKAGA